MLAPMTVLPEKARNSAQTLRVWAACQAEVDQFGGAMEVAEAQAEAEAQALPMFCGQPCTELGVFASRKHLHRRRPASEVRVARSAAQAEAQVHQHRQKWMRQA
jgi:hypothetical protein